MAIQDFGEKIGGAKKDLWKLRGLAVEDLLDMNEAEKASYIKKDNVWRKPDYQALVDSGLSRRVVYFMKMIRDATPTKPVFDLRDDTSEARQEKQEGYISFVGDLRDAVMGLKTEDEVLGFYMNYLRPKYILPGRNTWLVEVSPEAYGCLDNKLLKAAQLGSFRSIDRNIEKKQFCYSEDDKEKDVRKKFHDQFAVFLFDKEKVEVNTDYSGTGRTQITVPLPMNMGRHFYYPEGENADVSSWEEGKYVVIRGHHAVLGTGFDSKEDAVAFVDGLYQLFKEKSANIPAKAGGNKRKTRFTPKQLSHIQRDGDDYRQGRSATGEQYLELFGFRGGEFGNWMSENDRRASLDFGYDALIDMCKALNISTKDISLGGRLAIAFGARGSAGAAAHYEPLREVINLTKMHGAGSLAHEWAHALDDIFGKVLGLERGGRAFMTENAHRGAPDSMKALMEAMRYKTVSDEAARAKQQEAVDEYAGKLRRFIQHEFPYSRMSEEQREKLQKLTDDYINGAPLCKEGYINAVFGGTGNDNQWVDALSAFHQEVSGRIIPKETRLSLASWQNQLRDKMEAVGKGMRVRTDFYEGSIAFDHMHSKTDHGYWQSEVEMFARAFACYVNDKIEGKSDYLVGHSEAAVGYKTNQRTGEMELVKAIPDGEERKVLNLCFDNLIRELKDMELLHDFDLEPVTEKKHPSLMDQIRASQKEYDPRVRDTGNGQLAFDL